MCLGCIKGLEGMEFTVCLRMDERVLAGVFEKYKKACLVQEKRNERQMEK